MQIFERRKVVVIMVCLFLLSALISVAIPSILGQNTGAFYLAAILFFLIPILGIVLVKKRFLHAGSMTIHDHGIEIDFLNNSATINWMDISAYQVQLNVKGLFGQGYQFKTIDASGKPHVFCILEKNMLDAGGNISEESTLLEICRSINQYNAANNYAIALQPTFLASGKGTTVLTVSLALVIIDIIVHVSNKMSSKSGIGLLILLIILTINILAKRTNDLKSMRRINNIM